MGGSFGKGLIANVVQGYEWLVENYNDGDDIFIFGFSRGAFTARSLAGFVTKQGLLTRGAPLGVGQIYDRYKRSNCETIYTLHDRQASGELKDPSLEEHWTLKYSRRIDITMVGVWDTVGALGVPAFNIPGVSTSTLGFLHTGLRQSIRNAFQAVAIDEHRLKFAPTLWTKLSTTTAAPRPLESVEQRWFVGAHANVGGGYQSNPLSQPSLSWMITRAERLGLAFAGAVSPDDLAKARVADSHGDFLKGSYRWFSPPYMRPINAGPVATGKPGETETAINETIDGSVFDRYRHYPDYRPANLLDWAKRAGFNIADLKGSVLASNPSIPVPD